MLLLCSGCADTSSAPPATTESVLLAVALALLALVVFGLWVALLLFLWQREGAMDDLVGGVGGTVFGSLLAGTIVGQLGDWLATAVLSWGAPGSVVMGLAGAVFGIRGAGGSPLPWIILWGLFYPRPELLLIVAIPTLITQAGMLAVTVYRLRR